MVTALRASSLPDGSSKYWASAGLAPGAQSGRRRAGERHALFLATDLPERDQSRQWNVARERDDQQVPKYAHLARLDQLVKDHEELRVETRPRLHHLPDITVSFDAGLDRPILHAAISCKFSIRCDRVQNIRHESVAMIRHRRGRQPHIVTVTSEPLPSSTCRHLPGHGGGRRGLPRMPA